MIAGAALAAWLADLEGQHRSREAMDLVAATWARHPLIADVGRGLSALPERNAEGVLGVARAFLDREEDIAALLAAMCAGSRADPFFRPPFYPITNEVQTGLLLYHGRDLSISLSLSGVDMLAAKKTTPRGPASISFPGITGLFRFVKAGGATLSFWEAPPIGDDFVAARAGTCRFVERRRIADGEELVLDGRSQSFVIEHAASDILYFHAMVRPEAAPLSAEYDSRTLAFVGASSTDETASRIQLMVSLLRTMEREDAVPVIAEALQSPHFYTRWHVMRELLALDADAAHPHLLRMAEHDPHPEVRAAARQTLDLFFAEADADKAEDQSCRA
jgi:HEAT repeats